MDLELLRDDFPELYRLAQDGRANPIEEVLPGLSAVEIQQIEQAIGVSLPASYKRFLLCYRGFLLLGGAVQLGIEHPFLHDFPVGVNSPSQGMLCFGEFFMEGDGDQVLFDVSQGLQNDEYPVMYYAHESRPPTVRLLASSFSQWLNKFLKYEEFASDDDE